jgi:hypothetical protein
MAASFCLSGSVLSAHPNRSSPCRVYPGALHAFSVDRGDTAGRESFRADAVNRKSSQNAIVSNFASLISFSSSTFPGDPALEHLQYIADAPRNDSMVMMRRLARYVSLLPFAQVRKGRFLFVFVFGGLQMFRSARRRRLSSLSPAPLSDRFNFNRRMRRLSRTLHLTCGRHRTSF